MTQAVSISADLASPLPTAWLSRHGTAAGPSWSLADAQAYVTSLTNARRENFSVLSRVLPVELRQDFAAVYAFCRWADDLADEIEADTAGEDAHAKSLSLLAWWRSQLEACGEGEASHPVFVALAETVKKHRLPLTPFCALLDAFEQDQRVTRYATWDEVLGYCKKSADPVGHLVLMLSGVRPPEEEPGNAEAYRMSDLACSALQLTNHWQDVRRDLVERDRVYLPSDETGFGAEELRVWMNEPQSHESRVRYILAVRALVDRTRVMYEQAEGLPKLVGGRMGGVIWLLVAGGRATLRRIERGGCTTLWQRPTLGLAEKLAIVAKAEAGVRAGRWGASR